MRTMRWMLVVVAMGGLSLGGCASGPDDWAAGADVPLPDDYGYVETPLLAEGIRHEGSIGNVRDFAGEIFMTRGATYGDIASIEIRSENRGERWAAMTMLHAWRVDAGGLALHAPLPEDFRVAMKRSGLALPLPS